MIHVYCLTRKLFYSTLKHTHRTREPLRGSLVPQRLSSWFPKKLPVTQENMMNEIHVRALLSYAIVLYDLSLLPKVHLTVTEACSLIVNPNTCICVKRVSCCGAKEGERVGK